MTYIGQAQIETQVKDESFKVGDIVKMKAGGTVEYKVLAILPSGSIELLVPMDQTTWFVRHNWIAKIDAPQ